MFVTGETVLLPSCLRSEKNDFIKYNYFNLTQAQMIAISDLSRAVLSWNETPKVSEAKLHLFVIKTVDECLHQEDQKCLVADITELQSLVSEKYKIYPHLNHDEHTDLLLN